MMQPQPRLPPPSSTNGIQQKYASTPHAISRSAELLSVARTSLRILQQQQQQQQQQQAAVPESSLNQQEDNNGILSLDVQSLALHDASSHPISNDAMEALEEATLTLNLLDATLRNLSGLVRRRGTTNDPTEDINVAMKNFQTYSKMILEIIQSSLPQAAALSPYRDDMDGGTGTLTNGNGRRRTRTRSSGMRMKHYEMVAGVLRVKVEQRMEEFKKIMAVRGNIIKDLTLRRKQLLQKTEARANNNNGTTISIANSNGDGNPISNGSSIGAGMNLRRQMPPRPAPRSGGGIMPSASIAGMERRGGGNAAAAKSQLNSPLFTKSIPKKKKPTPNGTTRGYGGGYGGGYGNSASSNGTGNPYSFAANDSGPNTGMRRRAGGIGTGPSSSTSSSNGYGSGYNANHQNYKYNPYQYQQDGNENGENKIHENHSAQAQIQMRRQTRQTQKRLENARQAEKTLAELTNMFSKMSSLIHSQGETLVKIEDDVEAAMDHVEAGKEEIVKLYEWTQGNRGLIIKMFAIMIFLIIFMRFYG